MTTKYVVACDGSAASMRALELATDEAGHHDASVVLAHILDWAPYSFLTLEEIEERHKRRAEELERARKALMKPLTETLSSKGIDFEIDVRYGHVAESLIDIVEQKKAAQLFIGRTGQSELKSLVFGSVASTMAQISPVPCTVVP